MVSIRKRKGKKGVHWLVDYRDGSGRRRYETCRTREEAGNVAATKQLESGQARPAALFDLNITVKEYGAHWLETLALSVKPRTRAVYGTLVNTHVLPALGWMRLRMLHQARIRAFLAERLESGLAAGTVRLLASVLGAMLSTAVDDGLLLVNPARGVRRKLRVLREQDREQAERKALTSAQLALFLETARVKAPRYHPLFLLMARTGLRVGEAVALRWPDVDLVGRQIRVAHTMAPRRKDVPIDDRLGTPKSGKARTVDMSRGLHDALEELQRSARVELLAAGCGQAPWLFVNRNGLPFDAADIRVVFARVVKAAKLPEHLTPHCLRHTFAVELIRRGTPLPYVQAQLGHASISMTVDTYGRWLPSGNRTPHRPARRRSAAADGSRAGLGCRGRFTGAWLQIGYKSRIRRLACLGNA